MTLFYFEFNFETIEAHAPRISFFESADISMKFYKMYDLFEFVLHLYDHLCFIYGKIICQCSFRNGKSTTVLPYKNRIKPKSLVQMKFGENRRTIKKGNMWGMGLESTVLEYGTRTVRV